MYVSIRKIISNKEKFNGEIEPTTRLSKVLKNFERTRII